MVVFEEMLQFLLLDVFFQCFFVKSEKLFVRIPAYELLKKLPLHGHRRHYLPEAQGIEIVQGDAWLVVQGLIILFDLLLPRPLLIVVRLRLLFG